MPWTTRNGQQVFVDWSGQPIPPPPSAGLDAEHSALFTDKKPATFAGTPGANDLKRANNAGWRDAGFAAGANALGTAAQLGLSMIDTAQDKYAKERLAAIRKDPGLTQGERAEIDERAMRGVRALAAESQERDDAALAASGQTSAAGLQRARAANADAVNRAAIAAADIGIQAERAEKVAKKNEKEEIISYNSSRARDRINFAMQGLTGTLTQLAKVYAANPAATAPTDAQIAEMRPANEWMKGLTDDQVRSAYVGARAGNPEQAAEVRAYERAEARGDRINERMGR
jgi:hypothetical protein